MATFIYKVRDEDTIAFGSKENQRASIDTEGVASFPKQSSSYESISTTGSSVLDITKDISFVESTDSHVVGMADGSYEGQTKKVILSVDGGTIELQPSNLAGGSSITMGDALDSVELMYDGDSWVIAQANGITLN